MPRRKTNYRRKTRTRKGKGIGDWIKEKATKLNNYLKEKKFVHKLRDVPILGGALNLSGMPGMAAWGLDKLGYGKCGGKITYSNGMGKGRKRKPGRKPKSRMRNYKIVNDFFTNSKYVLK